MSDNPYSLRFEIWQEAKQGLMDKFYADTEVWKEWKYEDNNLQGECPIKEKPMFPTNEQITEEADKIYAFVQKK